MDNYIINPFTLYFQTEDQLVLQNKKGIVFITDQTIIETMKFLESKAGESFPSAYIENLLKENSKDKINFLKDHSIIELETNPNFNIEKVHFYSNNVKVEELVSNSFNQNSLWESYKDIKLFSEKIKEVEERSQLFFVFLNPYNKRNASDLRDMLIKKQKCLSIFSYIFKGQLYIESIYSSEWKTPCHLCQINHIESELRLGSAHGITYQQVIDFLYQENSNFSLNTPLDFSEVLNISTQIVNRINLLFALNSSELINFEEFTRGIVLNLNSKKLYSDTTHHWELCDCYE